MRRRTVTGLGAALAVAVAVLLPSAGAVSAPSSPSAPAAGAAPVFKPYAPQYMTRTKAVTKAQALGDASEFGVIAAKAGIYDAYLPAMRAVNPGLVVVGYLNAAMALPTQGSTYPASWYVRDAAGVQVRSKYSNYMMDVRQRGWVRNRTAECQRLLAQTGYDGCLLDIMGPGPVLGPFGPGMQVDREPIDARTGVPWTQHDWMVATVALANAMQAVVAPKLVYGNGIGDGPRYFGTDGTDGTNQLLSPSRSMIAEGFLRPGRAPINVVADLPTWQANIAMIRDAEARGVELLLTTKVWTVATAAQKDQAHEFSLGSYLLAAGGRTRWVFLYDETGDTAVFHPWWAEAAQLGAPQGAYTVDAKGVYQRSFVGGRVLVNPGATTLRRSLGQVLVGLDGRSVTSVSLPPHSARVLRNP